MADPTPEEKAQAEKEAADKAAAEQATKDKQEAEAAKAKADQDAAAAEKLGDAGKAALDAERKRAKDAEKRAKDAETRLKALEDEKLSDTEKLKKQAEDGKALAASATEKLRKANLISALTGAGVTNAKAAARLIDGVTYDDEDEPSNLDDAIKAAKAEYGEDLFKGAKPKPPGDPNAGNGNDETEKPALTAEELEAAKSFGMTPEEYATYKDPQPQIPAKEPAKT